jgi:hypothetical protein
LPGYARGAPPWLRATRGHSPRRPSLIDDGGLGWTPSPINKTSRGLESELLSYF